MISKQDGIDGVLPCEKKIILSPARNDLKIYDGGIKQGVKTWIVFDSVADKYFRISEITQHVLSFLNDCYDIDAFRESFLFKGEKLENNDIKNIYNFLLHNGLIQSDGSIDFLVNRQREQKKQKLTTKLMYSYLFFKVRLFSPDNFISYSYDLVSSLLNRWVVYILIFISLYGYFKLVLNWDRFYQTVVFSLNYSSLIKYGIIIIILKVFHELSHAYTAKKYGIRIRSFGLGFIVFFPRFFTDVTDSWQLDSRKSRALIDAAGILFEIFIGGIAALIWLNTASDTIHTIAYYVLAISIINTILVNGNPFIRYDGYYLLSDILDIDNLQRVGAEEVKKRFRKYFFGISYNANEHIKRWKKNTALVYGISSFIYKLFLYTGIILIVYFKFTKAVGLFLVAIEIYALIIRPICMEVKGIKVMKDKINKKNMFFSSIGLVIILGILFIPLPWSISIPCEVISSNSEFIYSPVEGYLETVLEKNYEKCNKDSILFKLYNSSLVMENKQLQLELKSAELEENSLKIDSKTLGESRIKHEMIQSLKRNIVENNRQIDLLEVRAPISGTFFYNEKKLSTGKWISKGESLGEVFSENYAEVKGYCTEEDLNKIKINKDADIYLVNELGSIKGKVKDINFAGSNELLFSPILSVAGGPLQVLIRGDKNKFITQNKYYIITISIKSQQKNIIGRTGTAYITSYYSLGYNFIKNVISIVNREFSF